MTNTKFVRLLFLKLKQKKNMKKYFLKVFASKLINVLFWGSTNFCRNFFFCFSFKNSRHTNVDLVKIFFNALKKVTNCQKQLQWRFWRPIVFKNTDQKDICASFVFKAESKPKHEETFFVWVFLKKPKTRFFKGPK